ncbi:MAG: STAS/SEC14 domain-containing protein [Planctomycetes bacterium]|nr:STAS/SEC14 domain-containing protein [Planctomycetota bacterium]
MPVELQVHADRNLLEVHVSEQLRKEDYERFTPTVDSFIEQNGSIRILLELHDFHGWDAGALWEDIKFGAKHFSDIEKMAVVGDKQWETGLTLFCKPFTTAEIRFFEPSDRDAAKSWVATN